MKYFATLPVRRDWIIDNGEPHLLAIVDEENLRRCLHLIDLERQIRALQEKNIELAAELERLAQ